MRFGRDATVMFTDPIMLKGNAVLSVRQYASNIKLNPKGFFIKNASYSLDVQARTSLLLSTVTATQRMRD